MGRSRRKGRPVDGILLLDKPAGITSNGALQRVKHLFGAAKAGHTGSLDPIATGVLPICFGEATKFSQFLLDADKSYVATIRLGEQTTTGDSEGECIATQPVPEMSRPEAEGYLDPFRGEIEQIPSMYSALKVDGQPLYKLARQGIEVERKARPVTIFRLTLLEQTNDTWVIDLVCSKGTYVRTLAEDLGAAIGCGAHVVALRRRQAGPFQIDESYSLDELDEIKIENAIEGLDAVLLPVSAAVDDYPEVEMTDLTASYFLQGQAVQIAGVSGEGMVAVYAETDEVRNFVGVGSILDDGRIAPRRLVTTR
jgi:tRNA pseudouridine55 synthase